MLQLTDLAIGYGQRVLSRLDDVTVKPGDFICLLGRNGQGKSTLLRTLAGFIHPIAGQAVLDGRAVQDWRGTERARKIAVVLTDRPQLGALGVTELVELGRQPHTDWSGKLTAEDRRIAVKALDQVGASHLGGRFVDSLSDGERQRVMIARALAQQPALMLLDEITAFLDLPSRVTVVSTLRRIARETGVAIILSSHDLELSLQAADRLWLLPGEGRFIEGAPEDVALSGAIGQAFDQDNLAFSLSTGRFEAPGKGGPSAWVEGRGVTTDWLIRALVRIGWRPADDVASADALIRVEGDGGPYVVGETRYPTIGEILADLESRKSRAD